MQQTVWRSKGTIGLVLILAASLPGLQAQSGKSMGGMGMKGTSDQSQLPAPVSPEDGDLTGIWRQTMVRLNLNQEQIGRMISVLQSATAPLSENWRALQDLQKRESTAQGDQQAALRKRIELAHAERDLIVESALTDLRDFLAQPQVELVSAAAFHGISRGHSEEAMPMTMDMGKDVQMKPMNGLEDLMMRLAAAALPMNEGFRAGSLAEVLKELGTR